MSKKYIPIIVTFWLCLLWASPTMAIFDHKITIVKTPNAIGTDSLTSKEKDTTKTKKITKDHLAHLQQLASLRQNSALLSGIKSDKPLPKKEAVSPTDAGVAKTFRSFPSLDNTITQNQDFNVSFAHREPEFNAAYIATNFQQNPAVDKLIKNAKGALNAVAELGNFVDIITGNELLELPVGLKKQDQTSGNTVELAITEVKFTSEYALLKIWARLTIPEKGEFENEKDRGIERELFFGAEDVKLSHKGGLSGDMKLALLGNVPIPINGDNWLITLKGGINLKTGAFNNTSFIEFNCSDLKGISLEGDVRVSRNVLLPIDDKGAYICGASEDTQFVKDKDKVIDNKCYVGSSFSVKAEGWNDMLFTVNLPRFEVQGLKGWGFNIKNVRLDLSDTRNAPNLVLPSEYNTLYPGDDKKLWRGFYAEEVSVMLPKGIENTKTSNKRVEFGAKNLILDSQGVSGTFFADNVLQKGDGAAGKWAFTIEDVSISLSKNSLTGGSIGGDIAVPIFKDPMDYKGYIAPNSYGLEVGLQKDYKTPVFLGEMQLERNSSIAINVKDGNVYPYANLSGKLAIAGKINQKEGAENEGEENEGAENEGAEPDAEDKNGFTFNGISFQELELQTEPGKTPIQAKSFGYTGEMKLMNFPASISDLKLITPNNKVGLSFDLKINLDDSGSHATTSLDILGKLEDGAKIQEWKFEKVQVDGIAIKYTKSNFTLEGKLKVMENDPIYGDGFDGALTATFKNPNFKVGGRAIFGKTAFRYWSVDVWTDNVEGNGASKLPIKAFVGGISNRMRKVGGNASGFEPGTAVYQPDANTGLGIRAGVKIQTKNADSFSCKAYLEMEYNRYGGLNRIGFMGEGAVMGDGDGGSLAETGEAAAKVEKGIEENSLVAANKNYGNYLSVAQESIPLHDVAASGKVGVYVGIERDFVNNTFDGEFELYMDLSTVKGAGANNLAGYAKIHTDPNDWYIYIGTPKQRIDLLFNSGVAVRVGGYFMTGTKLPPPDDISPHPMVTKILGDDIFRGERKNNQLTSGKGFAFGMNFGYGYRWDKALFYAAVELGAGFDVMHAHYPNAKCKDRPGPVGNNGWYSMGQVYAYLHGEFGVKVDLAFIKGNFKIAEAGVAAALRGQFPNPVYIQGYVGMYYNILGGLVSGRMRMKVELGEECELENISNAVGVPMISDLTPRDKSDDVSVFAAPQAVFNYSANSDFKVDLGEGVRTFKLQLKNFIVTSEGSPIEGSLEWNDTNDAVTFKPAETLPSEKEVKVVVEVSFDEKIGGSYQTMIENGKPVVERQETTFITDIAPDHIEWENVAYTYPVPDQNSFYPEEYNKGYVKMISPQNYLFDKGFEMRAAFTSEANGQTIHTNLSYDRSKGTVFYDIPEMVLNTPYTLNLIVFPPGADIPTEIVTVTTDVLEGAETGSTNWFDPVSGTQETKNTSASAVVANKKAADVTVSNGAPKSIFDYDFKTSEHASFEDKINDLVVTNTLSNFLYADVHSLSLKVANYEYLEEIEVSGGIYTGEQPLVYAQAILDDRYYKNKIYPLLYKNYPLDGTIRVNRDEAILGVPPIRSFYIASEYTANLKNNPNSHWVKNRIPFVYNLPYQYKLDFIYLRDRIANTYNSTGGDKAKYDSFRYLIDSSFPPLPLGDYKTQLIYRTPGALYSKGYKIKYTNN